MAKKPTSVTSARGKPAAVVKTRPAETATSKPALSAAAASVAGKSAEELADQAGKLDAGRQALTLAGAAAAAAQAALTALPTDSSTEDRAAAETKLEEACQAVAVAEAELQKLTNPGEAINAEAPSPQPAGATGTSAPAIRPEREAGSSAAADDDDAERPRMASAFGRVVDHDDVGAEVDDEVRLVVDSVRAWAATGDLAGALAHLAKERAGAKVIAAMAARIDAALAAEEITLRRTVTCWPLQVIRYSGEERPIGEPLAVEQETFEKLFAAGIVSDTAPS